MFRQAKAFIKLSHRLGFQPDIIDLLGMGNLSRAANPFLAQFFLFVEAIKTLSMEQQSREWMKEADEFRMLGAYAQTELAHGSDV